MDENSIHNVYSLFDIFLVQLNIHLSLFSGSIFQHACLDLSNHKKFKSPPMEQLNSNGLPLPV